jgi:PadR family transcriptional regulator PadR
MGSKPFLGELEQIALLAVRRLGPDAYGATIRDEIEGWTGRFLSVSAVYVTLMRLEKKGHVRSWLADPTPVRGGKAKRYFEILPSGVEALQRHRATMNRIWADLDARGEAEAPST